MEIFLTISFIILGIFVCVTIYKKDFYKSENFYIFLTGFTMTFIFLLLVVLIIGAPKNNGVEYLISVANMFPIRIGILMVFCAINYIIHNRKKIFLTKVDKEIKAITSKAKEIDNILEVLNSIGNKEQKQYIDALQKTRNALKDQVFNIYMTEGINIAKEIETNYSTVNIRKELDELLALQELNKGE